MSKHEEFTAGDIVALILTIALALTLLLTTVMVMVFDRELGESGMRLLTTVGAGLVGGLSVYIGHTVTRRRNGKGSDDEE